jgi:NAD dependent epimerase/dehydratase
MAVTQRRKVLVTGADGFIGSHLTERLVELGHDVRAFTCYNSFGSRGWLDGIDLRIAGQIDFVAGDIRDAQCVAQAMKGRDATFHLAALIAIPFSYRAPESYVATNVNGTLNVLKAGIEAGCHVIHTSTSEVYGTAQYVPIDEKHPLNAQSPYAATKIGADQLALSFARSFGGRVSVVRPFNTYGPRQSIRAVIPSIIVQAVAGQRQIRLGALHPTRDFSYVADTVSGFIGAMVSEGAVGQVVNVGSEFEVSIGRTVDIIADQMGVDIEVIVDDERLRPAASEVERLFADASLARRTIGFDPAFGGEEGFRRGLSQTIAWFSQPANRARYRTGEYGL